MGLGEAMMEEMAYRDRSHKGKRVFLHKIPSMLEYKSPSAFEMPECVTYVIEDPDKNGPFGAKEVGQGPLLPMMPAVANAVFDAVGVRVDENPVSFEKVFAAMQAKDKARNRLRAGQRRHRRAERRLWRVAARSRRPGRVAMARPTTSRKRTKKAAK